MRRSSLIIAVSLLLFSGSCSSSVRRATLTTRDSIRVEIKPREVIIRDTIFVEIPHIEQRAILKSDTSRLENRYSRSEAVILSTGELSHSLEVIAQQIIEPKKLQVEVRDSVIFRDRFTERIVEREQELSAWQRFCISGFYLLLALVLLLFYFR